MDISLYVEQQGTGRPIVFIHGSYATTSTWKRMVEKLALTYHCISIKLPGHGGAPDPADFSNPTIETELAVIEKFVKSLTKGPIHLVGHSYGGVVALAQAMKGNLPVAQLTLFEPVAVWVFNAVGDKKMKANVETFLKRYRRDAKTNTPYCCGQVIDYWGGDGTFAAFPAPIKDGMQTMVKNNIRHWDACEAIHNKVADLQSCRVPTRLVYGSLSSQVAVAICGHLNDQMPCSQQQVIDGASHFLVTSHANECTSIICSS